MAKTYRERRHRSNDSNRRRSNELRFGFNAEDAEFADGRVRSGNRSIILAEAAKDGPLTGVDGIKYGDLDKKYVHLITPFPIDDIPERPALEIGAQIVAEEIDGAMTVLITGRRDMRRDQYLGIGPEP